MTDFAGYIVATPLVFNRPTENAAIRERADPSVVRSVLELVFFETGTPIDNQPLDLVSFSAGGAVSRSFFEDYYNRIHVIPLFIDFGAVASRTASDVVIWNAYLSEVDLTAIAIENGEDITIEGDTLPAGMGALQYLTYSVVALAEGTLKINASITFTFNAPEIITISVYGIRARVAPVVPNWKNGYTIKHEYKTDISVSRSGKEQRRALRGTPRKSITFTGNPRGTSLRLFEQVMASWQNNPVILPEYPKYAKLAEPLQEGSAEVVLDSIPDWLVDDALVVLRAAEKYDTRTVSSIDELTNTVIFTGSASEIWPAGTKVHPGLTGRFPTSLSGRLKTNQVGEVAVIFDVLPTSEPVIDIPIAGDTFNDRELYMVKPNWGVDPTIKFQSMRDTVDFGRGKTRAFSPIDFQTRLMTFTYLGRDYATALSALYFFIRRRGMRGEFYMPSWEPDIIISQRGVAGSTQLRVEGAEFATVYTGTTVYKALTIFMKDGTIYHHLVDSIVSVDDMIGKDTIIELTAVLEEDIPPEDVRMISWLHVWRFATDSFSVKWHTEAVAEYHFAIKTLEDLT